MTPADLRAARKTLGLTQHKLAEVLRMGKWGFQSVAKWEKGEIPVPGPVALAIDFLLTARAAMFRNPYSEGGEWVALPREVYDRLCAVRVLPGIDWESS